ncbi:hypothetical protein M406DRAFT_245302 [Cryphonectria parasitica EP155]|uniref:Rhodopsin domain-containing protein n=1 Tax=Cryphonectria parasitica (strain ATCC 38755 / EP155) TaxID=660469 RepID=A0A9P5CV11_CRYP1|nr:uncharacterized protein M406DRAFT_245302 [Cryphonectria parasitica EP155]KAF3770781.1 hypothetical protein M406DRAFT_245302 [Cryphonectria parasitica EP155]
MALLSERVVTAVPPPAGYTVDLQHPRTQYITVSWVVQIVGLAIAFFFVIQRLYVKIHVRRRFGWDDDSPCVIVQSTSVATQVIILRSIAEGWMGIHAWEMPLESFLKFSFWNGYVNLLIYCWTPWACKTVILLFYLDINSVSQRFRAAVYVIMFIVSGTFVSIFFSSMFACNPIPRAYDSSVPGTCYNRLAQYNAYAILGVITDLMIILLPVPMVVGLHTSIRRKIGLLAFFLIGSLTCITSLVRLILLIKDLNLADITWNGIYINLWISIEANLLIICSCLSTLRLFFHTVSPGLFSTPNNTTNAGSGPSDVPLQTIGGSGAKMRRKRSEYSRFGEPSDRTIFGTATAFNVTIEGGGGDGGHEVEGHKGGAGVSAGWPEDSSSETAIVQTRTTEISFSKASCKGKD